jgi:hypothetical protein
MRRVVTKAITFGGQEHRGWLPPGASTPLPTPREREIVDFAIVSEGRGYLLEWCARPSPTNREPRPPKTADCWYEKLDDALRAAEADFGIAPGDWIVREESNPTSSEASPAR